MEMKGHPKQRRNIYLLTDSQSVPSEGSKMARITKTPDARREELIDVAQQLFARKGYEGTSVSDIVKRAKVAQGTFYYYFESKENILDAIAKRYVEDTRRMTMEIASKEGMNAIEKMLLISSRLLAIARHGEKVVAYLHEDRNAHLHLRVEKEGIAVLLEPLTSIIEQGVREGLFDTEHSKEAVLAMIATNQAILDTPEEIVQLLRSPEALKGASRESSENWAARNIEACYEILERIVGARPGIFKEYAKRMEL